MKKLPCVLGIALSVVYLANPTAGIFELLPDNLPWIGNLDEAAFAALAMHCLRRLRARPAAATPELPPAG